MRTQLLMATVIVPDTFLLNSLVLPGLRGLKLMDNQHIDIKEVLVITLRSENGLNMIWSCRMTLGNTLNELILTLLCRKSYTAIPAPSEIGRAHV